MLQHCLVTQRIGAIIEDSEGDDDRLPDYERVFGTITFTPNMMAGDAYKITDAEGNVHVVPALKITAQIMDGEIVHEGEVGIPLFAAGENSNPNTISYKATYSNLKAGGRPISLRSITFEAVPGETVDLGLATPVAGTPGVGIVEGPPGEKGDTPYIQDGTWWVGGTDTGVTAAAEVALSGAVEDLDLMERSAAEAADQQLGVRIDGLSTEVTRLAAFHEEDSETVTVSGTFPTNPGWATLNTSPLPDGWSLSSTEVALDVPGGVVTVVADIPDVGTASVRWEADDEEAQLHTIQGPSTTLTLSSASGGQLVVTGSGGSGYGGKDFSVEITRVVVPDPLVETAAWSRTVPIQFWGDSAVAGGDNGKTWAEGEDLPAQLATHLTVPVRNLGKGGWSSSDILFHAGFLEVWATPVGGQIPASGTVELDLHRMQLQTDPGRVHIVEIEGIRGNFSQAERDQWEFTRYSSGSAVPVTSPTRIVPIQHFDSRSTQIIVMGGNDRGSTYGTGPSRDKDEMSLSNYVRAAQAVPADPVRHILIGGVKTRASTWPGDDQHIHVQAVNETLRRNHPDSFVDRNSWLAERGLDILGLTPTSDDLHKMRNGVVPARVFADDTHVRKEVVVVEAAELWAPALQLRGWA